MKLQWSCEERDRKECRNAHGCHCREITALMVSRDASEKAFEKLRTQVAREHAKKLHRRDCLALTAGERYCTCSITIGPHDAAQV